MIELGKWVSVVNVHFLALLAQSPQDSVWTGPGFASASDKGGFLYNVSRGRMSDRSSCSLTKQLWIGPGGTNQFRAGRRLFGCPSARWRPQGKLPRLGR